MSKEKKFDVESISGYQYMEEGDKEYFEKFGSAMSNQAELIAREYDVDSETMKNSLDYLINTLESNSKEYIVNGAPLACSYQRDTAQLLTYGGNDIVSKAIGIEEMSVLRLPQDRKEGANGHVFANVLDTQGGLRDEILMEENKEEDAVNIVSFGNCERLVEDKVTSIEAIAEKLYVALQEQMSKRTGNKASIHITKEEVLRRTKEAIEQGKGTCYCCMHLNPEWENMPPEYDFGTNSFRFQLPSAGVSAVLDSESYMQFNGVEGINMMSMVFCRRGGIVSAMESGQNSILWEDMFTDLEKELLEKFSMDFAYENWPEEKQKCAEVIWQKFYVEEGYSAYFVAGLIGNMFGEGQCGLLEDKKGWNQFLDDKGNAICVRNTVISNICQAEVACRKASGTYGIGMLQWSNVSRKETLFQNYQKYQLSDGTLSEERLIKAEIDTIYTELIGSYYSNRVIETCNKYFNNKNNIVDNITYATCVLIKEYEIPRGSEAVDSKTYKASEDIWINAQNAEKIGDVHTVCQRIIAAKIAYEQFMQ